MNRSLSQHLRNSNNTVAISDSYTRCMEERTKYDILRNINIHPSGRVRGRPDEGPRPVRLEIDPEEPAEEELQGDRVDGDANREGTLDTVVAVAVR